MTCTWFGCDKEATHPQTAQDGKVWANLCDKHAKELDAAMSQGPKAILSSWVKAQGGAKSAARRMVEY